MRTAYQYRLRPSKDLHFKAAKKLVGKGKHIGYEALNVGGVARTRLAKSTYDDEWDQFL